MLIKNNNIIVQQAQHICTAPIQRQTYSKHEGWTSAGTKLF